MSSILPQGGQQDLVTTIIKYPLLAIQSPQNKDYSLLPKIFPKSLFYFINILTQAIEFRSIPKSTLNHLHTEQQLSYQEILGNSFVCDRIQFEDIVKFDKRMHKMGNGDLHHLIAIYDCRESGGMSGGTGGMTVAERDRILGRPLFVIRLRDQVIVNQFIEQATRRLKQQKQYMKKSTTNFLGIEQSIRKIIQKILLSSPPKRDLYSRITQKLTQKKITLTPYQNKLMIYALMGNHPQMQNFLRKERIQAYDLDRRRYDDYLREEGLREIGDGDGVGLGAMGGVVVEGYSQKRKLDGIIPKRSQKLQKQQPQNPPKTPQLLYISKIPLRTQSQIDTLLQIHPESSQKMQPQQKITKQLPNSYRAQKIRIPVKQYSIVSKEVQRVQRDQGVVVEGLDRGLMVVIEIVRFMYQMIWGNWKEKERERDRERGVERERMGNWEGPLEKVLDCLKDVMTECQRKYDEKKSIQNKSILELLNKANKNYLQYRKNPNKFY